MPSQTTDSCTQPKHDRSSYPFTFIAGIYGMNFVHMPGWRWGYPTAIAVMAFAAVGIVAAGIVAAAAGSYDHGHAEGHGADEHGADEAGEIHEGDE